MSFSKKFLKSRAACKVQFTVTAEQAQGASCVYLVGDFNSWSSASNPMKKLKNGGFSLEVDLPSGQDYQFRYVTDSGLWFNDDKADAYVPSPFSGDDNSLVKV
ncbi:MAG: isoamylase early set domain-containing protein [Desulfovibrio sp.]|nr:isoamylase early set domain-containing protein [Desulfovibrio sp.]